MSGWEVETVERRIYALAAQHGIAVENMPTGNDSENVQQRSSHVDGRDPVEDIIATLRQKGFISGHEATQLYWDHVQEKAP